MNIFYEWSQNLGNAGQILTAGLITFVITLLLAPKWITLLHHYKIGKNIREIASDGKEATLYHSLHHKKSGTPTMGGVLIWGGALLVIALSRILSGLGWIDHSLLNRKETYLPIFTLVTVALLGAVDDYFNIRGLGKSKGLDIKPKFLWLTLFCLIAGLWFYFKLDYNSVHIPGVGDLFLGLWAVPVFMFIMMATAHSVNFTDGLDGLAGGLLVISFGAFGVLAYAQGLIILSSFCAVLVGACLAFLWYNIPPARFYMGDTGALALGATLGVIAMLTDSMLILPFIGFIFVIETLSIILQLFSKKFFGKKIFHIAPIHHHFEYLGWPEFNVVMRFWIIGALVASVGLVLGIIGMGS